MHQLWSIPHGAAAAIARAAVILAQVPNFHSNRLVSAMELMCPHRTAWFVLGWRITVTIALTLLLLLRFVESVAAAVRITDDRGGNIGAYWSRYMALRDSGEPIVIDGICSSACTLVLGIVPHDRICVTANAVLGFHAAWRPGFLGFEVINDPATRTLWNIYPVSIRQWISGHGGLGSTTIYLSGPELFAIFRQCR
jgi:hypothetical protein